MSTVAITEELPKASNRGRRIPGKPGRFAPDRPLHMTTRRRAANSTTTNGSPSINDESSGGSESPRAALDDTPPTNSYDNPSQLPHMETQSIESATKMVTAIDVDTNKPRNNSPLFVEDVQIFGLPSGEPPASPSRKRKRSSSPQARAPNDNLNASDDEIRVGFQVRQADDAEEGDFVEVIDPSQLSSRQGSESSSQTDEQADPLVTIPPPSTDATATGSNEASPASSMSASQDDESPTKIVDERIDVMMQVEHVEEMEVEEAQDLDDNDEPQQTDDEGRPKRVFGGGRRRRAKHHIAKVEAAMQRQSALKTAFRQMTRALKPVLAEIGQRTLDDLHTNNDSWRQAAEHHVVMAGLDAGLERRRICVRAQRDRNAKLLQTTLEAEAATRRARTQRQLEDMQDLMLNQLEHRMLEIARAAQLKTVSGQYDTEDEDDVVPQPIHTDHGFARSDAMDPVYDSRSRAVVETEVANEEMYRRYEMGKMLQDFLRGESPDDLQRFTTLGRASLDARKTALAKREGVEQTNFLAEAARVANKPIIPNEEAVGLQMLGDLAARPSIAALPPAPVKRRRRKPTLPSGKPSRPLAPPVQAPQPSQMPPRIELSPRTAQMLADRYEGVAMPPPSTPRRVVTTFADSLESNGHELPMRFPITKPKNDNGAPLWAREQSVEEQQRPRENGFPSFPRRRIDWPFRARDGRPGVRNDVELDTTPRSGMLPERHVGLFGIPDRPTSGPEGARSFAPTDTGMMFESRDSISGFRPLQQEHLHASPLDFDSPGTQRHRPHQLQMEAPRSLHDRPLVRDQPSSSGATDRRATDEEPHMDRSIMPGVDTERFPRPRNRSPDQLGQGLPNHLPAQPGESERRKNKTNKRDRRGQSRKEWKQYKAEKGQDRDQKGPRRPLHLSTSGGPAANNVAVAQSPTTAPSLLDYKQLNGHPWRDFSPLGFSLPHPSDRSGPFPLPPPSTHFASPFQQEPSSQHLQPGPTFYDPSQQHQHRNSYPPPKPPPANWVPPAPSPLYQMLQGPHPARQMHPPPRGVMSEQFRARPPFMTPPPPHLHPQPHLQPFPPHSAPGSHGPHYGGQPIAPAEPLGPRGALPGYGLPPQNLPAFAQQQRQADGGPRRRTQSDAHRPYDRWHSFNPARR